MSTTVRRSGLVGGTRRWQQRGAFTLSDGSAVVVVQDENSSSSQGANYGDKTNVDKVYVYHSTDRQTWILRATLNTPLTSSRITANVSVDNSIGIVCWTDTAVRYASVSSTWVASAWETVRTAVTAPVAEARWDIAFTSTNIPVLAAIRTTTTGSTRCQLRSYIRRTSDSSWIAHTLVNNLETNNTPKEAYLAVSVAPMQTGTATARPAVLAVAHGTGNTDRGVKLYTVMYNETTGTFSAATQRGGSLSAGDVPRTTTSIASRNVVLFQSDDDEYTLAIQHYEGDKIQGVTRGTFDGTSWTETVPYVTSAVDTRTRQYNMAVTYSAGRVLFLYSNINGHLDGHLAKYDAEAETFRFAAGRWFDNKEKVESQNPMSNGGPHVEYPTHDTVFVYKIDVDKKDFVHHWIKPSRAPIQVTPANGATVQSSLPTLRANADLDIQSPQSLTKIRWEFASDAAFTTNFSLYEQDDSKLQRVSSTHLANSVVPFDDVLPAEFELFQGLWYVRSAHVDEFGVVGAYSTYNNFTVSHPPTAAALTPNAIVVMFDGGLEVSWEFTDPSPTDFQTAFQVIALRDDTGAVIHDSGKIISQLRNYVIPVTAAVRDVPLRWYVILWDQDDVEGPASASATTMVVDAPTVNITAPTVGQVLTTAIPHVLATVTVGGARWIAKYRVTFTGTTTHNSGWINTNLISGQQIDYQPPPELLENNGTYTIRVETVDNLGVSSVPVTRSVTTAWVPPASSSALTVSTTPYNTEGQGWIAVSWSDANRDVDFAGWIVYRRANLLDPLTGLVLEQGDWTPLAVVTTPNLTYLYRDYTAPSGYQVQYRVEQSVVRFGDVVESISSAVQTTQPIADSYWLIEPEANNAFRLGSVTSDSYTEEFEEADYVVIGRGSRYEQGERKGYRGTLTCQIRNSAGVSARQHKLRLEEIKKGNRRLYLRNPFGDLFRVAVGGMTVSRIAGVGLSEFVDVTVPYFEVSE